MLFFGDMKNALIRLNTAVFLWGFTGVLGRAISLDAIMLVWWRLLITTISLWVLFIVTKRPVKMPPKSALIVALIGTILAMHWVFFYASIKLANVTIALTCLSTTALMAAVIEPLILGRRFDVVELVLGFFAIVGIFIIYYTHFQFSTGIIIGLLSALFTVLVSVLNKKIIDRYEPEHITLYQLTGGFFGLSLLLPLFRLFFSAPWAAPATMDWIWLIVLSWVCTILTFFLYIRALKKVSAFTMNLLLTLEPVYGIILAFLLYKENKLLSDWFYVGFGLIAIAVVFHMYRLIRISPTAPKAG
jgi:drug/metabolite transporter (DMT)-like permease